MTTPLRRLRRHVLQRTRFVFYGAELFAFRLLLATASVAYVGFLILDPSAFQRHGYEVMATIAPWWVWTLGFAAHAIGAYWRIFGLQDRPRWALWINGLGFVMWTASTASVNYAVGKYMPSAAMEWTMCMFAGWSLYRTGGSSRELLPP